MTRHTDILARLLTGASLTLMLAAASDAARAAEATVADTAPAGAQEEKADFGNRVQELVVVATNPALAAAPAKASLAATQPQTIITREAIDQFVPQTADYTQIANLSPSVTGGVGQNGPGLSESKSTLRGFNDGNYNVTYDGIPWGDANGPTHHSTSFFPASTIGAVVVDRGPGKAGDVGIASFGGSINLFSPEVSHVFGGSETVTGGSFNTWQSVTKLNTGDIKQLNDARVLFNFQELVTDGYLTLNKAQENNQMIRAIVPINDKWQLTLFGAYNFIKINTNDNAGATLAQAAAYGKNFALTNDPKLPTYYGYNVVTKSTYFDYAKLNGELTSNLKVETQPYVYYYKNDTESTVDPTLTPTDVASGTGLGWTPAPGSKAIANGDVPGYIKLNKYQIYGDITHLDWNFGFGDLRPGLWVEHADTKRFRYDYDATRGRTVPDYRQKAGTAANGIIVPQNEEYDQSSGWDQYQPFVDLELRPTDKLTITPGFKWVNYTIRVNTLANQKTRTPLNASKTFQKDLEFLTVNYKLKDNWSVYGQYATGILVPDISAFQVAGPTANPSSGPDLSSLVPQTSTNYQLGTVYHGAQWTADFDVYKIDFKNRISTTTVAAGSPLAGEVLYSNQGGVTYQGVEGQLSYAFTNWLSGFANGSINDAKDNATNLQVKSAPKNTFGVGMLYKRGPWTASVVDKYVGEQWAQEGQLSSFHIPGYHQADFSASYTWDRYRLEGQVMNIANSQAVTSITSVSKTAPSPYDQYYWQAPRNFQVSLKAAF
ncbi:MAG: TonB-dependent receptor [Caulobacteraceae bacterium]|nr:TonB-dependent receptor [Caulobacteraceae bacterium]